MKYEAQRARIKKLSTKLHDIQAAFKFEGLEIVRSPDECIDEDKIYLLIDYDDTVNTNTV